MKKILLSAFALITLTSTVFAADNPAQSGVIIEGQLATAFTPEQVFNGAQDNSVLSDSTDTYNGGIGGGLFLGYDYAINSNMTVGAKAGYQYLYALNEFDANFGGSAKLNMNSIPVLATFKYYFNSGWLLGAEGGIDIQKWTVQTSGYRPAYLANYLDRKSSYTSDWSVAPMVGLSGGYQFSFGLALTGNVDYVFGKSTDDITTVDDNTALGFYTFGLNVGYKF